MRLPRIVEPLRHRDFRLLCTGQTVSAFGNFIHRVALPFQILALGGGALEQPGMNPARYTQAVRLR